MDYLYLGSTPYNEDCASLGFTQDFKRINKLECVAYIEALRRVHGQEPESCEYGIKACNHDFGMYYDVVIFYDPENEESVDYAFKVEDGVAFWSDAGMTPPYVHASKAA